MSDSTSGLVLPGSPQPQHVLFLSQSTPPLCQQFTKRTITMFPIPEDFNLCLLLEDTTDEGDGTGQCRKMMLM